MTRCIHDSIVTMRRWRNDTYTSVVATVKQYSKIGIVGVCGIAMVALLYTCFLQVTPNKLIVSFLDVGQGDAIFIQTPSGHDMLIDGGPTDAILEKLTTVMPFFDKHIDVILATHPDADHVTGLIPVLQYFDVDTVMLSPSDGKTALYDEMKKYVDNEKATIRNPHAGDVIDFGDGVRVRILYPPSIYTSQNDDTNDASVSVLLTYSDNSFLLTGDLPSSREPMLLDGSNSPYIKKNITVYKAGHHGSKTSSSELLLSYIQPEYTVISAGKDNRYGHPNSETLERLQKYSDTILSTIDRGTISFITDGKSIDIRTDK